MSLADTLLCGIVFIVIILLDRMSLKKKAIYIAACTSLLTIGYNYWPIQNRIIIMNKRIQREICSLPIKDQLLFRKAIWYENQIDISYVCERFISQEKDSIWVEIRQR